MTASTEWVPFYSRFLTLRIVFQHLLGPWRRDVLSPSFHRPPPPSPTISRCGMSATASVKGWICCGQQFAEPLTWCYVISSNLANILNPRPCTPIFITRTCSGGGGVDATPPRISKRRVVELSVKKRRIARDEFSRLVVRFLVLGQYLTQL